MHPVQFPALRVIFDFAKSIKTTQKTYSSWGSSLFRNINYYKNPLRIALAVGYHSIAWLSKEIFNSNLGKATNSSYIRPSKLIPSVLNRWRYFPDKEKFLSWCVTEISVITHSSEKADILSYNITYRYKCWWCSNVHQTLLCSLTFQLILFVHFYWHW